MAKSDGFFRFVGVVLVLGGIHYARNYLNPPQPMPKFDPKIYENLTRFNNDFYKPDYSFLQKPSPFSDMLKQSDEAEREVRVDALLKRLSAPSTPTFAPVVPAPAADPVM